LVGVAVKLTLVPEQMLVADAETATEGVTTGFTTIVIPVDVAVVGVAHAAVEVITHVIILPLASAALV